jgi:hypothetical protein
MADELRVVSASREIAANAGRIFELIADPTYHAGQASAIPRSAR